MPALIVAVAALWLAIFRATVSEVRSLSTSMSIRAMSNAPISGVRNRSVSILRTKTVLPAPIMAIFVMWVG